MDRSHVPRSDAAAPAGRQVPEDPCLTVSPRVSR